jgi:hypothetical protein
MARPRGHPVQFAPAAAATRWAARLAEVPPAGRWLRVLRDGNMGRRHADQEAKYPQYQSFWTAASSRHNDSASPTFPITWMRYSAHDLHAHISHRPAAPSAAADRPHFFQPVCHRISYPSAP